MSSLHYLIRMIKLSKPPHGPLPKTKSAKPCEAPLLITGYFIKCSYPKGNQLAGQQRMDFGPKTMDLQLNSYGVLLSSPLWLKVCKSLMPAEEATFLSLFSPVSFQEV